MLRIDLKTGDSVKVGEATITLEYKAGQVARLSIDADKSVKIERVNSPHSVASFAKMGISNKN